MTDLEHARKDGERRRRARFVEDLFVKRIGLPVAAFMMVLMAIRWPGGFVALLSWRFFVSAILVLVAGVLASYGVGWLLWKLGLGFDYDSRA